MSVKTLIPLGVAREGAPDEDKPRFQATDYRYQNFSSQEE